MKRIMQNSGIIHCSSSTVMVAIIFILSCSIFLPIETTRVGFSTELIHRNSPLSPLYKPNLSLAESLRMASVGSLKRYKQIGTTSLIPDGGQYLMKISYGTPAIEYMSLIDTGSTLSWIQCLPCIHCYPSEHAPFNPQNSRTFQRASCRLRKCLQLNNPENMNSSCKPTNNPCNYDISYLSGSRTRGELARETITVGSRGKIVTFPNFLFGCGHENTGLYPHKSAGVIGFGPDGDSFISQLSSIHGGKIAHCFAPVTSHTAGRISFGNEAVVSGSGVVSTPLVVHDHYYIMLEGVTVGNQTLTNVPSRRQLYSSSNNISSEVVNAGGIVVDTGSTSILLPESLHIQVEVWLRKLIHINPTTHPPFTLCYPKSSLRDADIPKITFHFTGANVVLNPVNTFVDQSNNLRCLAMLSDEHLPIFGNLAMTNFLVGYDFVNKRVSFKPMECRNY